MWHQSYVDSLFAESLKSKNGSGERFVMFADADLCVWNMSQPIDPLIDRLNQENKDILFLEDCWDHYHCWNAGKHNSAIMFFRLNQLMMRFFARWQNSFFVD